MNRIIVLGSSGSGKSTLAQMIGELLDIEVIHLDSYYWQPNWVATPEDDWATKVQELLARDRWVMDGNYPSSLQLINPPLGSQDHRAAQRHRPGI